MCLSARHRRTRTACSGKLRLRIDLADHHAGGARTGGLFIRALRSAWASLLDSISLLGGAAALMPLPDPPVPSACEINQGMVQSIAEGLQSVKARVALRWLLLAIAVLNFALAKP